MPSTIIGSSEWNTRGIVLSSQSAQEQVNGLVNVQVQYAIPASKQYQIDRMFYVDAPPPIWPTVVNRAEMLTNNLYMVQRTINRSNGLVIVNADYVGALQRAGFGGYFLREVREVGKRLRAYRYVNTDFLLSVSTGATLGTIGYGVPAPQNYTPSGALRRTDGGTSATYNERIKLVEYVRISGVFAATLPLFVRSDLASVLSQKQFVSFGQTLSGDANSADLWIAEGPTELLTSGLLSFEPTTPVSFTETSQYVTPRVEVVTREHRLSR